MSAPPSTRVRVQGFHCDLYGHVNNARYLEFLEAARWDALHDAVDVELWHDRGLRFVVVNIDIDYRRPATLGHVLVIRTRGGDIGRTSAKVAAWRRSNFFLHSHTIIARTRKRIFTLKHSPSTKINQ